MRFYFLDLFQIIIYLIIVEAVLISLASLNVLSARLYVFSMVACPLDDPDC